MHVLYQHQSRYSEPGRIDIKYASKDECARHNLNHLHSLPSPFDVPTVVAFLCITALP